MFSKLIRPSLAKVNLAASAPKRSFAGLKDRLMSRAAAPVANPSYPPHLLAVPATKVTVLPNNVRVATEESHGEVATVGVWIDAGSAYENDKNNGVAHFLEHMTFKGTARRTREQLDLEVENMGAQLNAYTAREQTAYYAKVFKEDVGRALDILSDNLLNPLLDERLIEAERSTILREMEEVNKDNAEVVFDNLHAAAYQGTPLARTILGPTENINRISRADLQQYIQQQYQGHRMVVVGSGAVKHEQLVELASKSFGKLPTVDFGDIVKQKMSTVNYTGSSVEIRDDTMPLLHFAIAVESVPWSDPDYFTFLVIQTIIGSWDRSVGAGKHVSSRLGEIIAREGLARQFNTFTTFYNGTGLFGAYAVTEEDQSDNLVSEILYEWNRMSKTVTQAEVERAKTKLKSSFLMSLDGTMAVAEDIGRQMLTIGRRLPPVEVFARIDDVKLNDVMEVAQRHLSDVEPTVVTFGPSRGFPDYTMVRERTYWRRW